MSAEQKTVAEKTIADLGAQGVFAQPIVTEVTQAGEFFVAEAYHQDYFEQNPAQPYCQFIVSPKVVKFRSQWANRLKKSA